jgi:hypothetical protein
MTITYLRLAAGAAALAVGLAACSPASTPNPEPMKSDAMKPDAMKSDSMSPMAPAMSPMAPAMSPSATPMAPAMSPDAMKPATPHN